MGDLLLVAGGLGINPLYGMLQHHAHLLGQGGKETAEEELVEGMRRKGAVCLLYSAKNMAELIFKVREKVVVVSTVGSICENKL